MNIMYRHNIVNKLMKIFFTIYIYLNDFSKTRNLALGNKISIDSLNLCVLTKKHKIVCNFNYAEE